MRPVTNLVIVLTAIVIVSLGIIGFTKEFEYEIVGLVLKGLIVGPAFYVWYVILLGK